jgi:16S rRNA (cytidine1402-2'-O)-methyltransferase
VLLIGPPTADQAARHDRSILEEIGQLMREEGLDQKSALKRIARLRGISKSEAYRLAVAERAAADRLL